MVQEAFQVDGKMDFSKYQHILEANVTQSVKKMNLIRDWLLQQYSDPKHTSKSTINNFMKYRKYKHAVYARWPTNVSGKEMFCKEKCVENPLNKY